VRHVNGDLPDSTSYSSRTAALFSATNQHSPTSPAKALRTLARAGFLSTEALDAKIEAFIACFNATMAKPFKWSYQGKPLAA